MTRQTIQDPTFDHDEIEVSNVIERYLMGKLTVQEADAFEDHFLDCEECLERLELSRMLYQGMQEVAAEEVSKALTATTVMAWLARRGPFFQGMLALGLLVLVALPWALWVPEVLRVRGEHQQLAQDMARALSPHASSSRALLSPERSGPEEAPSTRIAVDTEPGWVVLVLQLPPYATADRFRVGLIEATGVVRWESGPLEADRSHQVTLSVHSSWLETSTYHLEVRAFDAADDSQSLARFSFQAVRRDE